ncbi:sugar ABC transporter permease [Aneurinibacillus sp. Ricciae_BoGa-3]|uniref:ABC transporter permease n=1 Tax=Aneurinibacillus sp. Ricciae_BoGa-3 TaxID=3022697 RepID=UPI0023419936|nr:sugar ABC transporter permease [Aneurinibacillus sp. Ricciae_BoGa-3]WCK52949.1 sugar ABC transporter permease [Aneurinibacillus sp. Ricciae_BoGa-3]
MWRRNKAFLLVLPAWTVITILFFGGLVDGLIQSMGYFPAAGQSHFSLFAYKELLRSDEFWSSLLLTLRVAFLSTISAGILGVFVAVCLFMLGKPVHSVWKNVWQRTFGLPLIVPHLVGAYLMVLLFMQSGWLSRMAFHLGWIKEVNDFPIWINDPFGWGIIFSYAWKEAPFIALMLYPVLLRTHRSWFEVAQVFGANIWSFIREIVIPLLLPAWLSSSFIVFSFTFSAFEVPFLLGVTYPKMLPVLSYELYTSGEIAQRPEALTVNVLLALIAAGLGLLAYRLSRRWLIAEGRGW